MEQKNLIALAVVIICACVAIGLAMAPSDSDDSSESVDPTIPDEPVLSPEEQAYQDADAVIGYDLTVNFMHMTKDGHSFAPKGKVFVQVDYTMSCTGAEMVRANPFSFYLKAGDLVYGVDTWETRDNILYNEADAVAPGGSMKSVFIFTIPEGQQYGSMELLADEWLDFFLYKNSEKPDFVE